MIDSVGPEEKWRLLPLLDSGLNNSSVWRHDNEIYLVHRTLGRLRETHQPERKRLRAELLRFECPDLDVVKGGREVSLFAAGSNTVMQSSRVPRYLSRSNHQNQSRLPADLREWETRMFINCLHITR
jgi:hypothetical protein